ncbi:MAG: polysaccharide biosynthesis tyrosine autokinase [Verrucomicrobiales bacterium]|nr:polysaccharide biosynthesis tyrosine autokinase [Verrucomicrobiales bacterium]
MEQNLTLPGQSANLSRIHETSAKFQRYKVLLRRRWWFLLLTSSIGVIFAALNITGKPVEYKSIARLVAGGGFYNANAPMEWREHLQDFYGTVIDTIEGATLKNRALERVRTMNPDQKESDVEIDVVQNKNSAIFNIIATGSNPAYTQKFLDALIDEFIGQRQLVQEQALGKVLTSFADGAIRKQKEFQIAADKLATFRKQNDIINLTNGSNEAAATLSRLNQERDFLRNQLVELNLALEDVGAAMQKRERGISNPVAGGAGEAAPTGGVAEAAQGSGDRARGSGGMTRTEQEYITAKHEVLSLRVKLESLLKLFRPQHPDVVEVQDEMAKAESLMSLLEKEIVNELRQQKADLERQISAKETTIAEKRAEALDLGAKLATDAQLLTEVERTKKLYDAWVERTSELNQVTSNMTDYVVIQERASVAIQEPEKWLVPILIGLVGGLGAGALILLLFDRLDDRMNSYSEFVALFPNEAVLGQVPEQRQRGDVALLRPNDDRHLYAEAFRNIRSSILFKDWQGQPPKTILVTSAVPNEGKTTVTTNLAITMALSGARVLLADCDLRRGGVNELFKIPASPGLSDALRGNLHWRDAVQETSTRNLDVLPRGEVYDQTSEMLLSRGAEEIVREMADEYDYVIFDSAPVLVADDTASFAPKLDTVLFVVRLSSTMARLSGKAMDLLYDRQVNVGGVILNRSSSNLKEYTYYNYASYYYTPKAAERNESKQPAESKEAEVGSSS